MEIDQNTLLFNKIFNPGYLEDISSLADGNKRFVYYTSSDTAVKILRNHELWFRNASVMNDFSEIAYGLELIQGVFFGREGANFRAVVDSIFPDTIKIVRELITSCERDWRLETYIACVSQHDAFEDRSGRLSMWRAYGDTAIVVNNTPFISVTDLLAVYSVPVLYLSEDNFAEYLSRITDSILEHRSYLESLGQQILVTYLY